MIEYTKKYIAIVAFAFLGITAFCHADSPGGYASAFLELPPMASSVAFAGACLTYDPEPAALFWNPANLSGCHRYTAQVSVEKLPLATIRTSVAAAYPFGPFSLAAGYLNHYLADIATRDILGQQIGSLDYSYNALAFGCSYGIGGGHSRNLSPCMGGLWQFAAGVNIKYIDQNEGDYSAGMGYAVDAGVSGRYAFMRYGLMIRNILGEMEWNNQSASELPMAIIAGLGYEYCESQWIELSLENKVSSRLRWRAGGQILATDWAGFRAGIDFSTGKPAAIDEIRVAGGGVIYYTLLVPLELSYSVQYINAIRGWAFSTSLSWNTF